MSSSAFQVSRILNMVNLETNTITASIDSDAVKQTVDTGIAIPVGTISVSSADTLPLANIPIGQQGFVTTTNKLYIYNGSGWYNIAAINNAPYWDTEANATYALSVDGTSTTVTIAAGDSDGTTLTYTATGDSNFNAIATVTKDSDNGRIFYITAIDSENSASPTAGSGILTFRASDGIDQASTASTFSITFFPDWSASPTESIVYASDAAASDYFGRAVSMSADGTYAIVGAERNDDVTTDTGSAYIYTRSGSTWTQQAKISASDKAPNEWFGRAVSISSDGTYAVISKAGAGAAYIFVRSGSTWTQQQKLTGLDFPNSVSINSDGTYVAIGASIDGGNQRGAVYIYSRSGSTWTQQQKLTSSDLVDYDRFGHSVSINSDGTYVVATAYADDDVATDSGSAYIFTRSGSTWTQQAKLTASDASGAVEMGGSQIDTPGSSASINSDGTYVIVGAFKKWVDGVQWVGAAYIFTRSGSTWTEQSKITPSDVTLKQFGQSVSINSDATYAIIGAHGDTSYAGAAYVFSRSGSTWTQERKITASDGQASDYFGVGVSLSSDAKYAIVGSQYEDGGSGDPLTNAGAAYFYEAG